MLTLDRLGHFALLGDPRFTGTGLMFDGLALLLDHTFRTWEMRKLYAEALEYNLPQFKGAIGRLLEVEGRLRQHTWRQGRWWDRFTLTLERTTWEEYRGRVMRFVTGDRSVT
ncbi:MAG: N-acetyltransferase [Actinobacteria bacterium]|nr:MAG: N-acetyltransferase [Actinomycetota bacterium]RIK03865.1 MAG: hypothetical protein DCC48_15245 [Acidobacteriota bacterium]